VRIPGITTNDDAHGDVVEWLASNFPCFILDQLTVVLSLSLLLDGTASLWATWMEPSPVPELSLFTMVTRHNQHAMNPPIAAL
jgi:hypothetical protein